MDIFFFCLVFVMPLFLSFSVNVQHSLLEWFKASLICIKRVGTTARISCIRLAPVVKLICHSN